MDVRVILSGHERVINGVSFMSFTETGELRLLGPSFNVLETFQVPWRVEPAWTDVTVTLPVSDDAEPVPPGRSIASALGICSCRPPRILSPSDLDAMLESILEERGLRLLPDRNAPGASKLLFPQPR